MAALMLFLFDKQHDRSDADDNSEDYDDKEEEDYEDDVVSVSSGKKIGSHQFKVSNGDNIFTERLKFCEVNDKLILDKVLLLGSACQTIVSRPILPDAAVHAVVEEHELTQLRITDIEKPQNVRLKAFKTGKERTGKVEIVNHPLGCQSLEIASDQSQSFDFCETYSEGKQLFMDPTISNVRRFKRNDLVTEALLPMAIVF
ncbi:hypothetical protein VNO78_11789 [Psophocarpus tetragonolobus]|uniref:Large ribosomal subunit protein bL21m n=1 Tax=Psophocarpus tetragonolobus TaxID=3891 RepID=A0AAN9SUI0_PSOTE